MLNRLWESGKWTLEDCPGIVGVVDGGAVGWKSPMGDLLNCVLGREELDIRVSWKGNGDSGGGARRSGAVYVYV